MDTTNLGTMSPDELKRRAEEQREQVKEAAGALQDRIKEKGEALQDKIKEKGEQVERVVDRAKMAGQNANSFVHRHPYWLIGGATAIGAFLGARGGRDDVREVHHHERKVVVRHEPTQAQAAEARKQGLLGSLLGSLTGSLGALVSRQLVHMVVNRLHGGGDHEPQPPRQLPAASTSDYSRGNRPLS